ncbi:MAG: protein-(glutamine-N5) methyltransferase, release factor-specific [Helicobacteraceae bacterium 4484_230]|nr:MAG: protein-(glutamine-N5) methyltransferase, release factor-specific [Helicobacteraceae bacterium 4484_230]
MAGRRVVSKWIESIASELSGVAERPRREAELLLMAYLQRDQIWLITHPDTEIEEDTKLIEWIRRRKANEPLEYITNSVSFYSEIFHIEPGVLIPRPETELLIDEVLSCADSNRETTIAEVGTGSGVISIVLARHLPKARIIAVDISSTALEVARKNITEFGLEERIELRHGNLLDPVEEKIDILVSNPPYIARNAVLESNLDYEPDEALFGGEAGNEIIIRLIDTVLDRDIDCFACEMGYDQKEGIVKYLEKERGRSLRFYKDLAGFDRGFVLKKKGKR